MAILVGWSTAMLTIGLAGSQFAAGAALWLIAGTAWLLSIGVTGIDARGSAVSAATWLVMTAVWLSWRDVPDGASTVSAGALALLDRVPLFYVAAGGCLVLLTRSLTTMSGHPRDWAIGATLGLLGGAAVAAFSIRLTGADILARAAILRANERDYASAVVLYRGTIERDRSNDGALTHLADALMTQADAIADRGARDALLSQAGDALARAQAANPFEYHHPRNLAALQRRWARGLSPEERGPHLAEADRLYQLTTDLAPARGVIWAEWGNLEAERRKPSEALTKLDHAAALGAAIEAIAVSDVLLRAEGGDVTRPGAAARLSLDLKSRGYPALAALYADRAAAER
jgi:hypothetical protein